MISSTSSPVPTGTVDLVTTTVKPSMCSAISLRGGVDVGQVGMAIAAARGVPTAMKMASAFLMASFASRRRTAGLPCTLVATSSARPGSKIGITPASRRSILAGILVRRR